jgi:hypothetical protein
VVGAVVCVCAVSVSLVGSVQLYLELSAVMVSRAPVLVGHNSQSDVRPTQRRMDTQRDEMVVCQATAAVYRYP